MESVNLNEYFKGTPISKDALSRINWDEISPDFREPLKAHLLKYEVSVSEIMHPYMQNAINAGNNLITGDTRKRGVYMEAANDNRSLNKAA